MKYRIALLAALLAVFQVVPGNVPEIRAAESKEIWSGPVSAEILAENITPEDARREVEARAKAAAIEKVAGTRIYYNALIRDASDLSEFLLSETGAWVKSVRDIHHELLTEQRRSPGSPPVPVYRVTLDALVAVDPKDVERIPLRVELNRKVYEVGDEMLITIEAGQDCYVHVFNVLSNDSVTVILPNRHDMVRFLKKGRASCYPPKDGGPNCPRLAVFLPNGVRAAREKILVVATKDDVDLAGGAFGEANFKEYPTQTGLLKDLVPRWMEIPPSRRAVRSIPYEIRAKESELKPSSSMGPVDAPDVKGMDSKSRERARNERDDRMRNGEEIPAIPK